MTSSACRWSWIFASAWWLAADAAVAQSLLEIRPADRESIASEPRQVVTTAFRLRNLSAVPVEVETRLELPPDWQAVTPAMPIDLSPAESTTRLVSFTIPEGAPAGEHVVRFSARDRLRPAEHAAAAVHVRVLAAHRLNLGVLDAPDFAVSGEHVTATVVLRNTGNAAATVDYRVHGRHLARVTPAQGSARLEPGETRGVDLAIELDEVRERVTARISVQAGVEGTDARESVSATIQLVPRAGALDALHTLDSRAETRFVARDTADGRTSGWQPSLTGGGVLDETRGDILRYSLRGPDRRQSGSFGTSEEYWLRYDTRHLALGAGDLNFGLTPLTEPGRLGRGASVALAREGWAVAAFGMRDNFGDGASKQVGARASLLPAPGTEVGLNFLGRGGVGDLWTVRAQTALASGADVDLELGRSDSDELHGGAVRFSMRGARQALRYHLSGWSADERFLGPLRDRAYLSAGFDVAGAGAWSWRGYYRSQDWNLTPLEEIEPDLHPGLGDRQRMRAMPRERQAGLGAGRRLGDHLFATLDLVGRHRDGRRGEAALAPLAERRSGSWRASLSGHWQPVSLQYSLEKGRAEEPDSGAAFGTSSQMLSASWRLGWMSCNAYWMRDEQSDLDATNPRRTSRGINASIARGGFSLNLDAQSSKARFGRSTLGALTVAQESETGARWSLAARRIEGRFARTDYFLAYSLPFRLPVMARRDVSVIRGRVFDAMTQAGLRNVVLRVDGLAAVTNHRGEFEFPGVRAGAHPILLEQSALPIDQVPAGTAPREVRTGAGPVPEVLIPMVRSAEIRVRVHSIGPPQPARATAGLLVIFRSGDALMRRLTGADGEARVGGIPPGSWMITVDEDSLPAGLRPDRTQWSLEVAPGEKALLEIALAPERRSLRMQPPLAVR